MRWRRIAALALILLLVAAGAFWWRFAAGRARRAGPAAGQIAVDWRGRFRGGAVLPATVNWCPGTRTALLQGISSDTGVAIVLHEVSAIAVGPHAAVSPTVQPEVPRPGATAAIRWLRDSATIVGFQSVSGMIDLKAVGSTVSGTIDVRMRVPGSSDTLVLRGSFDRVPVTATAVGCS